MAKRTVDVGHYETDVVLEELEKRITKEYAQAEKEIAEKLNDYLRRFETKDKIKRQAMLDGKISERDYEQWRLGQIAVGQKWSEMRDNIALELSHTADIAKQMTNNTMPEVYAINFNYGTYQVERTAKVSTNFTLYDKDSVNRLFNDENTIYHKYGKRTAQRIAEGKQLAWDKKQVQSCMTQALLQGESIGNIATRLARTVGDSDRKACIRNARTMTTGIENAGRVDSYKRAESMGIDLEQEWMATLDDRTRHEHRLLDGMRVKVGEKFKVGDYELEYPADPAGAPEMIYNCRCTLVPALKGFEADNSMRTMSRSVEDDYEAWKESRYSYSDPITKQDDIAQMMKESYNNDYRYLAGQPENIQYYKKTDDSQSDIQTPAEQMYKTAESIEEAKKYAKDILGLDLIDYDNVNLDYANIINETITKYYKTFANLNLAGHLDEIRIVPKLSCEAGYQPSYHALLLQKRKTSSKNIVTNLAKQAKEMKEIGWWSTGDQYTLVRHELGHAVQHLYLDTKAGNPYGNSVQKAREISKLRKEMMESLGIDKFEGNNASLEDIAKAGNVLSYYALNNDGDFIAEAVAEYMSGNPREMAKKVVEILIGE